MSRWFRFYADMLDDYAVQSLPDHLYRERMLARLAGAENEFSRFIKPDLGRPSAPEWAKLRAEVFSRDDYTCAYCGARGGRLECDHVMPVAKGGSHELDNLATACFGCNRSKRDKLLEEWRA